VVGPLTTPRKAEQDKTYVFPFAAGQGRAGAAQCRLHAVSLANNHTLDFGAEGLAQTIEALEAVGIAHIGAGPI